MKDEPIQSIGNEKWISMSEAAPLTPYSAEYLSLLARKKKLPSKKVQNTWYTTKTFLDDYMKRQMVRTQVQNGIFPALEPMRSYQGDVKKYFPVQIPEDADTEHVERALERVLDKKIKQQETRSTSSGQANNQQEKKSHVKIVLSSKLLISAALITFILLSVLPVPLAFSFFDRSLDYIKDAINDANTVMGFRPGTHENEILLLDKEGNISIMGHIETEGQLRSYAPEGIAPIVVDSTTNVENLSADYLDGLSSQEFTLAFVTKNGNITTEDVILNGNVKVGETLTVTGAAKLLSTLEVGEDLKVFGAAEFQQTMKVMGPAYFESLVTLANDLSVKGNVSIKKNLSVRGGIESESSIIAKGGSFGSLGVTGGFSAGGKITLGDEDDVLTINSKNITLDRDGNAIFDGAVTATGFSAGTLAVTFSTTTNATSTNFFSTTASSTNLFSTNGNIGFLTFGHATGTSATTTNSFITTLRGVLATITSIIADDITTGALTATNASITNSTTTNATSTSFFSTTASSTNLFAQTLSFGTGSSLNTFSITGSGSGLTFSGAGNHDITASAGTLRVGTSTFIGNISAVDDTIDIGSAAIRFDKFYANEVNATTLVGTLEGGNVNAETLTINVDNATADAEDAFVAFERGSASPNALIKWDSATDRFILNSDLFINSGIGNGTLLVNGSTTLQNLTFINATGTAATTTNFYSSGQTILAGAGGRVGIGTTNPGDLLHLKGADGFLTRYESATGNTFDLQKFSTRVDFNDSGVKTVMSLDLANGRVGIGTTTPARKLELYDASTPRFSIDGSAASEPGVELRNASALKWLMYRPSNTNDFRIYDHVLGSDVMSFKTNTGNVGIGTTDPGSKLSFGTGVEEKIRLYDSGTAATSYGFGIANDDLQIFTSSGKKVSFRSGGYNGTEKVTFDFNTGNVGIGTTTPFATLAVNPVAGAASNQFVVGSSTATALIINNTGNVGIGTTGPSYRLDVSGTGDFGRFQSTSASPVLYLTSTVVATPRIEFWQTGDSRIGGVGMVSNGKPAFFDSDGVALLDVTSSRLRVAATGTATNPALQFGVTSDAGFYITGSGIGFSVAGTEIWRVLGGGSGQLDIRSGGLQIGGTNVFDSSRNLVAVNGLFSGNVGIGTTSPWAKLSVTNTGTGPSFVVEDSSSPDSTPFLIDASGSVGVGLSTNLDRKLNVGSTSGEGDIKITGGSGTNSLIYFNEAPNIDRWAVLARYGSDNFGIYNFAAGADALTILDSNRNVGISSSTPFAKFSIENTGSDLSFAVNDAANDSTPFVIDASGNVGIGTTAPGAKLEIATSTNLGTTLKVSNTSFGTNGETKGAFISLAGNTANAQVYGLDVSVTNGTVHGSNRVYGVRSIVGGNISNTKYAGYFEANNEAGWNSAVVRINGTGSGHILSVQDGGTDVLTVIDGGNVGTGSTTPYARLSVSGFTTGTPGIVADALSGFSGNLLDLKVASTTKFSINQAGDLLATGSTTIQNFTFVNATGTSATTTNLFSTTASSTNLFSSLLTVGGNGLVVDASRNVGIGTSSPQATLHVSSANGDMIIGRTSYAPILTFRNETTAASLAALQTGQDGTNGAKLNFFTKADGGSLTAKMNISQRGRVTIGDTSSEGAAQFTLRGAGLTSGLNMLVEDSSGADKFSILDNGNVGIGTTGPGGKLVVVGASSDTALLGATAGATSNALVNLAGVGDSIVKFGIRLGAANEDIHFDYRDSGDSTPKTALSILRGTGNVGIGTTNPLEKLDVRSNTAGTPLFLKVAHDDNTNGGSHAMLYAVSGGASGGDAAAQFTVSGVTNWYAGIDNSDSDKFKISPTQFGSEFAITTSGNVGIGTANPTSLLNVNSSYAGAASFIGSGFTATINNSSFFSSASSGVDATTNIGGFGVGVPSSIYGFLNISSTNTDVGSNTPAAGITGDVRTSGSGAPTGIAGLRSHVAHEVGTTVGSAYGLYVNFGTNSGTLTNTYGLYVGDITSGTQTNQAYGLYVSDANARNYFAGNVGIGTTNPQAKLDVQGTASSTLYYANANSASAPSYSFASDTNTGLFSAGADMVGVSIGGTTRMSFDTDSFYGVGTGAPRINTKSTATYDEVTYGFVGDIDTGMYRGGANELRFSTANTDRVTINSSGNVGIGTTTPNGLLSFVSEESNTPTIRFQGIATGADSAISTGGDSGGTAVLLGSNLYKNSTDTLTRFDTNRASVGIEVDNQAGLQFFAGTGLATEVMRVTTAGNVGIGTTSPQKKLHVYGTGANQELRIETGDTNQPWLTFYSNHIERGGIYSQNDTNGLIIRHGSTARAGISSGLVIGNGYVGAQTGPTNGAIIEGNVGIGTTSPSELLHIYGSGEVQQTIGSSNAGGVILALDGDSNGDGAGGDYAYLTHATDGDLDIVNLKAANLTFATNGSTPDLTIDSSGNVGIGTTTPAAKLQVKGTTYFGDVGTAGSFRLYDASSSGTGSYINFTNTLGKLAITGGNGSASTENTVEITATLQPGSNNTYALGTTAMQWSDLFIGTGGVINFNQDDVLLTHSANALTFSGAASGYIFSDGNVGIGTTAPGAALHVGSTSGDTFGGTTKGIFSADTVSAVGNLQLTIEGNTDSGIVFGESATGSWTQRAFLKYDSSDDGFQIGGVSGAQFHIGRTSGNVGIGTTTPLNLLDVVTSNAGASNIIRIRNTDNTNAASNAVFRAQVGGNSGGDPSILFDAAGGEFNWIMGVDNSDSDKFKIAEATGLGTSDRLTIALGGNVGIGTTSPAANLQIAPSGQYTSIDGNKALLVSNPTLTAANLAFGVNGSASNIIQSRDGISTGYALALNPFGGNVGIGTTTPQNLLHVFNNSGTTNPLAIIEQQSTGDAQLSWYLSGGQQYSAGIDNSDSDKWKLSGSGTLGTTDLLTVTSSGNVGIGTTSPETNYKLDVYDSGGSKKFGNSAPNSAFTIDTGTNSYLNINTGGTTVIRVSANGGNVGIGTTNPGALLHQQKLAADNEHILDAYSANNGHTGRLVFRRSLQNTAGFTSNSVGSYLGDMEFYGVNSGNTAFAKGAEIRVTQTGSSGASQVPAAIHFLTSDGTTLSEQVRITSAGNVGIGTTTPGALLDVQGAAQFGTTNVSLIDSVGKITGLSSTYFNADTSANLATILSDETGSGGGFVRATAPTLTTLTVSSGGANITGNSTITGTALISQALSVFDTVVKAYSSFGTNSTTHGLSTADDVLFSGDVEIDGNLFLDSGSISFQTASTTGDLEVGGVVLASDGSASNPSYTFKLDNDLGLFRPGTNILAMSTAGSERMRIDASGNVGIGTTSPDAKLQVSGGNVKVDFGYGMTSRNEANSANIDLFKLTTGNKFQIGVSALQSEMQFFTVGTQKMVIQESGNVGIGTTTPGQKLSVAGDILGNNLIGSYFTATSTTATSTIAGFLDVNGTGSNATSTFASNLWVKGALRVGTGSLYLNDTSIAASNGGFSLNSTATSTFATNGLTVGTNQFVVQQTSGNVGIGTITSSDKLRVEGTLMAGNGRFRVNASGDIEDPDGSIVGVNDSLQLNGTGSNLIVEGTGNSSFAGNVGIGTTTPTWLLNPTSATAAQLALSSGAGFAQWAFRNAGGNLYFATTTVAGTATTSTSALAILGSSGFVGIGTTNPSGILDIEGATPEVHINSTTAGKSSLRFQSAGSQKGVIGLSGIVEGDNSTDLALFAETGGALRFYTNGSATESATLTSAGHLSVFGDITASGGDLNLSGVSTVFGGGSQGTFGALTVKGQKGGYGGINFRDSNAVNLKTLMITDVISGIYDNGDASWSWYFNEGALTEGTVPAARITQGTFAAGDYAFPSGSGTQLGVGGAVGSAPTVFATRATSGELAGYFYRANTGINEITRYVSDANGTETTACSIRADAVTTCGSDARLKTNINSIASAMDVVNKLKPVMFNWKSDLERIYSGFIAQDVQEVLPHLVYTSSDADPRLMLNQDGIIPYAIKGIQELFAQLTELKNTVLAFADRLVSRELVALERVCIGGTCINEEQLVRLLEYSGQTVSASSTPSSSPDSNGGNGTEGEVTGETSTTTATTTPESTATSTEPTIDSTATSTESTATSSPSTTTSEPTPSEPADSSTSPASDGASTTTTTAEPAPAPEPSPEPAPEPAPEPTV